MEKDYTNIYKSLIDESEIEDKVLQMGSTGDVIVTVKRVMNYEKRLRFIKSIVGLVIQTDENGEEQYVPDIYEFAKRYYTIAYMTDFVLPESIDDCWLILYYTHLYDDVVAACGKICPDIYSAVEEEIRFKRDILKRNGGLLGSIRKLINTIGENAKDLTPEKIQEIVGMFKELNLPAGATETDLVNAVLDRQNKLDK